MTILNQINEVKKEEVLKLKQTFNLSRFSDSEFFKSPRLSFYTALKNDDRISIIAEIKKASPSKGVIREDFNHNDIAKIYMESEVEAISVLTDEKFFMGSIKFLRDIASVKTVPLLRKDFIIDEYQVYEAKAHGADAILLIAESLSKNQISELTAAARETDLEVLLELHSDNQIEKISFDHNKIIGINNRDLNTFEVDLNTTDLIGELIPDDNLIVSESGIKSEENIDFVKKTKAKSILVGEHMMISENINKALGKLKKWCRFEN